MIDSELPPMSIFVVDDHPLMREAMVTMLSHLWPFTRVVEFGSFCEVSMKTESTPTLICLDLNMPGIAGCAAIRSLKDLYPGVPLVVYSASLAYEEERACVEAGADAYIEKSAGSRELSTALRRILPVDASVVAASRSARFGGITPAVAGQA